MRTVDIAVEPLVSTEQLKSLMDEPGPCVSIYQSSSSVGNSPTLFETQLKSALTAADRDLRSRAGWVRPPEVAVDAIRDEIMREYRDRHRGSFAIFVSRTTARIFWAAHPMAEILRIDDVFYIRPLLTLLASVLEFAVLALSQKAVRLLRCTDATHRVVPLPDLVPQGLDEALRLEAPDHNLENRSSAGGGAGEGRRIRFSTDTGDQKSDAYLLRFFSIVNENIRRLMRAEQIPLVLCAAEREIALYQKVNSYSHLLVESIHGSPEWLTDEQLREAALLALERERAKNYEKVASEFSEKTAGTLLEKDPESILAAASEGNVRVVLLPNMTQDALSEDLFNLIAVQTLRKGGEVVVATTRALPNRKKAVALLRHAP